MGSQKDPNKRSWFQLVQRSLTNIYQKNLIILLFFPSLTTLYHQISAVQARHILTNTHRSQLFISSIVHFKELLAKITNILSLKRSTIHHLSITHKYYSEMKVFTVNYCYSHHLFISGSFWDFSELQLNCLFVVHHTVQNYDSQSATCQSILWLYRLAGDTKCEGSSRMASRGMSWMLKYTGLPKNTLHAVHNDKWR